MKSENDHAEGGRGKAVHCHLSGIIGKRWTAEKADILLMAHLCKNVPLCKKLILRA
jgi:hypothetical protein